MRLLLTCVDELEAAALLLDSVPDKAFELLLQQLLLLSIGGRVVSVEDDSEALPDDEPMSVLPVGELSSDEEVRAQLLLKLCVPLELSEGEEIKVGIEVEVIAGQEWLVRPLELELESEVEVDSVTLVAL